MKEEKSELTAENGFDLREKFYRITEWHNEISEITPISGGKTILRYLIRLCADIINDISTEAYNEFKEHSGELMMFLFTSSGLPETGFVKTVLQIEDETIRERHRIPKDTEIQYEICVPHVVDIIETFTELDCEVEEGEEFITDRKSLVNILKDLNLILTSHDFSLTDALYTYGENDEIPF